MSPWGWQPERRQGVWRVGPLWLKPLVAVAPWVTLMVLLAMVWLVTGTLTVSKGTLFDLPDRGLSEGETTPLVAMVLPKSGSTLVFFDDSRYSLDDESSLAAFGAHLAHRASRVDDPALLLLIDRRVSTGELSHLAAVTRVNGVRRLLVANRSERGGAAE